MFQYVNIASPNEANGRSKGSRDRPYHLLFSSALIFSIGATRKHYRKEPIIAAKLPHMRKVLRFIIWTLITSSRLFEDVRLWESVG